ncbi:MAG: 4Fe-4S dicluster domain-containing protein [Desulfitobacteriia bacterium]|jgi:ech hydrogenase subunit F
MAFSVIGKTIMKSLFGKPATAMYPVVKNEFYPNTRGNIQNDINLCNYCGLCDRRCPAGAINVSKPERKWEIDRTRCIVCNYCVQVCARKALSTGRHYTTPMTDKAKRITTLYGETETAKETVQENA